MTRPPIGEPPPAGAGPRDPVGSTAAVRLAGELLREGKGVSLRVGGASMAPFVRNGDVVTLRPVVRVRVGDVVARLAGPDRLLIHRVVAGGARPVTRGDSATEADPALAPGELLGRVSGVERAGRRVRGGLGPERRLLAWLSRRGWLRPLLVAARRAVRPSAD